MRSFLRTLGTIMYEEPITFVLVLFCLIIFICMVVFVTIVQIMVGVLILFGLIAWAVYKLGEKLKNL